MRVVWDARKAQSNRAKHGLAFEEAATVFYDPLAVTGADPDHSLGERRWITFGVSASGQLLAASSAPDGQLELNAIYMKKGKPTESGEMRASYKRADFPLGLVRGKYAERVANGESVVRLKPEIAAAFPTSAAVNRALAKVLREAKSARGLKRSAKRGRALLAKAAGKSRAS